MFNLERQLKIEELLKQKSSLQVSKLSKIFGVSESTIRRDLQEMENRGLLLRTHGGAVDASSTSFEPTFKQKQDERCEDKKVIGKIAASMVEEGDTIILDTGTTTLEIAKRLTVKDITVITNSIDIAAELSQKENVQLIVTGGSLRFTTRAMVGSFAENIIKNFRVDKAFIGANGVSVENGVTTPNYIEAQTKKAMISVSKKVILAADISKFNKVCFSVICPLSSISTIITTGDIDKKLMKSFKEHRTDVITN